MTSAAIMVPKFTAAISHPASALGEAEIGAQIGQDLRHGVEVVPLEERRHRQEGDEAALIGRNHGR
jgi:hypothetical protein